MTPEENFNFLNSYRSRILPIIRTNRGFIDKYIGDAIMALVPHSPADAVSAPVYYLSRCTYYLDGSSGEQFAGTETFLFK